MDCAHCGLDFRPGILEGRKIMFAEKRLHALIKGGKIKGTAFPDIVPAPRKKEIVFQPEGVSIGFANGTVAAMEIGSNGQGFQNGHVVREQGI